MQKQFNSITLKQLFINNIKKVTKQTFDLEKGTDYFTDNYFTKKGRAFRFKFVLRNGRYPHSPQFKQKGKKKLILTYYQSNQVIDLIKHYFNKINNPNIKITTYIDNFNTFLTITIHNHPYKDGTYYTPYSEYGPKDV